MTAGPEPCCRTPQTATDCRAPHCLASHCPACGTGCDLNTPGGTCENVLRWSEEWSDQQAAAIRDLIGIDNCILLLDTVMPDWIDDVISIARSIDNTQAALAEVLS